MSKLTGTLIGAAVGAAAFYVDEKAFGIARYSGSDGAFGAAMDLAARGVATVVVCSAVGFALSGDGGKALAANASGFEADFDHAFEKLRRRAGRNLVPLADMREALPQYGRAQFDAGLKSLRKAWRYGLSPHEGRSGTLSAEAAAAGIHEGERLLVFVSRKDEDD